jgi:hypothetical protein
MELNKIQNRMKVRNLIFYNILKLDMENDIPKSQPSII